MQWDVRMGGPDPDAFDPADLIEDFEHPVCERCMGIRWVRDENGINMVTCKLLRGSGPGAGLGVVLVEEDALGILLRRRIVADELVEIE